MKRVQLTGKPKSAASDRPDMMAVNPRKLVSKQALKANETNGSDEMKSKAKSASERRPSFEIAEDYVELNFRPIIEADKRAHMTKKQLRKLEKAEKRREKQQFKQRHLVRNTILVVFLLLVIGIGSSMLWWQTSTQPVNVSDNNARQFVVDNGSTADDVAAALRKAGFIRNTLAFKLYVRLHGNVIQAGTHTLSPSYDLGTVVDKLTRASTDEISVQIPPGLTLDELRSLFKTKYDYTDTEIEAALTAQYNSDVLADRPAGSDLEGYIYPDTYRVYASDDLSVVINKSLQEFSKVAKDNDLKAKFAAQGLSFYQGVTLASIVTKEVSGAEDQGKVAGVFYNRLNAGMNLGSDVTFQYAFKKGLCNTNTPQCDSAYNTRINEGLPPGPIANPSLSALKAVANPTDSNYMYFVAGDDGKTYYSETADQHNQAVAQHCQKLCQ